MHLTDGELRLLIARAPRGDVRRHAMLHEMRQRVRRQLIRRLPSPTGVCASGRRIFVDDNGAFASGCVMHTEDRRVCYCEPWTWDPDTPERARLKRLIDTL